MTVSAPSLGTRDPAPSAPLSPLDAVRGHLWDLVHAGSIELPLLPGVVAEILYLTSDDDSEAGRIVALVHQDPALAGHVLRIANSPAYLPRTPIVTLQQAVTRLGMATLRDITLASSLQSGVFRVPGYEPLLKVLWRHSLASAAWAREVARMRRASVESSFLCGLLHSIGKPVVLNGAIEFSRKSKLSLSESELVALMDELETPVGSTLADAWQLPRIVRAAIATYACYDAAPGAPSEPIVTFLADRLATHLFDPERLDETKLREDTVLEHLNFYPDDVEAMLQKRDDVLATVEAMTL